MGRSSIVQAGRARPFRDPDRVCELRVDKAEAAAHTVTGTEPVRGRAGDAVPWWARRWGAFGSRRDLRRRQERFTRPFPGEAIRHLPEEGHEPSATTSARSKCSLPRRLVHPPTSRWGRTIC